MCVACVLVLARAEERERAVQRVGLGDVRRAPSGAIEVHEIPVTAAPPEASSRGNLPPKLRGALSDVANLKQRGAL